MDLGNASDPSSVCAEEVDVTEETDGDFFAKHQEGFILGTPWPVLTLTGIYLYFVLVFGPSLMKYKKPMALKRTLLVYNIAQVVFSSWWFYEMVQGVSEVGLFEMFSLAGGCSTPSPKFFKKTHIMGYWYLISKFVELIDTVFFILRGKQNQVTFLHVYHHTNMALATWFFMKNQVGIQSIVMGACNTFVHIVMYSYYLLAGLGPTVRQYLWWKRYITLIQITQFLVILIYLIMLQVFGCAVPRAFVSFSSANTFSFLVLFLHFYFQAYRLKNKTTARVPAKQSNGSHVPSKEIKAE